MFTYDTSPTSNSIGQGLTSAILASAVSAEISKERSPQIAEGMQRIERELSFQRETLEMLRNAIQPILTPAVPDAANGAAGVEPTCPLAAMLGRFAKAIQSNTAIVNEILRRIEL
jgi:hypothetical protein